MLKQLFLQNFVLTENLCVTFYKGLNIITGETGSGKSLIVDALSLLKGEKADASLIRTGFDFSQVTGVFELGRGHKNLIELLKEHGLEYEKGEDPELLIKRVIFKNGKTRAFINDQPVSVKLLSNLTTELIDLNSQYENQKLLDIKNHIHFFDQFAKTRELVLEFQKKYHAIQKDSQSLKNLIYESVLNAREKNLFDFELNQIKEANVSESELSQIKLTVDRGNKSASVRQVAFEIENMIALNDSNMIDKLKLCRKSFEKIKKISSHVTLDNEMNKLDEISSHLEDLAFKAQKITRDFTIDEESFLQALSRLEQYNKILQKYGPEIIDVNKYKEKCIAFIESSENKDEEIERLGQQISKTIKELLFLVKQISTQRKSFLNALERKIEKELVDLGMKKARFICQLKINSEENKNYNHVRRFCQDDEFQDFLKLSENGMEDMEFFLAANEGLDPLPLAKVASGGELSRVMLAIKNILLKDDPISVFVFDEIDSGVSGKVAYMVGRKLVEFCQEKDPFDLKRQVICITHLPQVACFSHHHFFVYKENKDNQTFVTIKHADNSEKISQVAFLLAGEKLTKESMAQARALIKEASGFRLPI